VYVVIRRYEADIASSDEVVRRVREGFLPLIRQRPGFVAYHLVDAGDGVITSISIFRDHGEANESTRDAAEWVKANLAELVQGPPEIISGEVVLSGEA
jgi:antibiotic biosynthesis monooxygenase